MFFTLLGKPGEGAAIDQHLYSWIPSVASASTRAAVRPALPVFVLLITGVGTLIHIYSIATWPTTRAGAGSSAT